MSLKANQLRDKFHEWAVWRLDGGWGYFDPLTPDNGVRIRAPGTHSDPTMSHILGMEKSRDFGAASVDNYVRGLPRVTQSLVYATFYDPLVDKTGLSVPAILRDYGINSRLYYEQVGQAILGLGVYFDELKAQKDSA